MQCLYEVLGVQKDASSGEIRKRYRQLALQLHPDKNPTQAQEASEKFQALQKVWTVLGDPERRKTYDDTGLCDDESLQDLTDLKEYFAAMFVPVTAAAIDSFALTYRGSEEESQDLLAYYTESRGDMHEVFSNIMCSESDIDSHRFMDIILEAQKQGTVKKFKTFTTWAAQTQSRPRVKDPLKPRKSKSASSSALVAAIQSRAVNSDAAFDALALKYAPKPKAKQGAGKGSALAKASSGPPGGEPSESEWAAASQRMAARSTQHKQSRPESGTSQPPAATKRQKLGQASKAAGKGTESGEDLDEEKLPAKEKESNATADRSQVKKGKRAGKQDSTAPALAQQVVDNQDDGGEHNGTGKRRKGGK